MNQKKQLCIIIIILVLITSIVILNKNKDNSDKKNTNDIQENNNQNHNDNKDVENNMNEFISKINININGTNYQATLEDNETTRAFINKLPLEINMSELNSNEKYYYLSESLPSNPLKIGQINNGDLMLYGTDCLVLFYESFETSYSYTRIGKIDNPSTLKDSVGKGNVKVFFAK